MIVPHRPPFLFVTDIVSGDKNGMRVTGLVPKECPYATGDHAPRALLVEALAQGMAAHAQSAGHGGKTRGGLAMAKNISFASDVALGEAFVIDVSLRRIFGKLLYYQARAETAEGTLLCAGELVAAEVPA